VSNEELVSKEWWNIHDTAHHSEWTHGRKIPRLPEFK
jgi:hypothetical protein